MNAREILEQLRELTTEGRKGVSVLYEVEEELAHAEHHLDTVEALAFLEAEGSVAERNVRARLARNCCRRRCVWRGMRVCDYCGLFEADFGGLCSTCAEMRGLPT